MKRFALLLLLSCIIINSGLSQQKDNSGNMVFFRGLVMDAQTFSPIGNSQILINRAFTSLSNTDGTFALFVNRKDTVVFKSLGYKPVTFQISDTLLANEYIAGIYMKSDTVSIGEVVIIPKLTTIKSDILKPGNESSSAIENAKYNVAISAYQARTPHGNLGDPASNYEYLKQKQKTDAYEKGGIPSDRILRISSLLLIPGAYMLLHGLPEKPIPMKPDLTNYELDMLQKKYFETLKQRK